MSPCRRVINTDSLLKETFEDLKRRGLWDDTFIIVTADHGEELHDHNGFFHHSPSLSEEERREADEVLGSLG